MVMVAQPVPDGYIDLEGMGKLMGVSAGTVRRKVNNGDWPHSRPGHKILFGPKDIEEIREIVRRPAAPRRPRVRKRNS